jgi:hypothetical protein
MLAMSGDLSIDVAGLTVWVRDHPARVARAWVGGRARRGVLRLDRNIRAGKPQTRVVVREPGQPDVVLYNRLIEQGGVEIKVGRRYVDVRDVLRGDSQVTA